eukprot:m.73915 g.73915  ORF g.73915 m.73915 type:complete len:111 (+) comp8872_c0_seq1:55-387(+)
MWHALVITCLAFCIFFYIPQVFLGSVAPVAFQAIYAASVDWCPPFSFYLIAGLNVAGLVLSLTLHESMPAPSSRDRRTLPEDGDEEEAGGDGRMSSRNNDERDPLLPSIQ